MKKEDLSLDPKKVYKVVTPSMFLVLFLIIFLYYIFLGKYNMKYLYVNTFLLCSLTVIATIVHELIHAISFMIFGRVSLKKIKFGIILKYLTPYAYCSEIITISTYRIALIMPTIILGVIPIIISFIKKDFLLLLLGDIMLIGGFGDLLVIWITRGIKTGTKVLDHDKNVGCYIISE